MKVDLYILGELLDQYEDESIQIVSSVLDVQDISKNTGDYSKEFSLPASKTNNRIFQHWYNSQIDNGFDSRTKVKGHIEIDGVPFRTGKWRLNSVSGANGKPISYKINFFGETSSIKDIVGKDKLRDLDFSAFDHEYTSNRVRTGFTSGLFHESIVYSTMSPKRHFYDSDSSNLVPDVSDEIINIAWNRGSTTSQSGTAQYGSGIRWDQIRPSIKNLEIVKAIEDKYAGSFQKTSIFISEGNTSAGTFVIVLDGISYSIPVAAAYNKYVLTTVIRNYIDGSIDGYSASTQDNVRVNVVAENKGRQIETSFDPSGLPGIEFYSSTEFGTPDKKLSFSRDFFQTTEFEQMYMWLNPDTGRENNYLANEKVIIDWDTNTVGTHMNLDTNVGEYRWFGVSPALERMIFEIDINVASGFETVPYSIVIVDESGNELQQKDFNQGGSQNAYINFTRQKITGQRVYFSFYIKSQSAITFTPSLKHTHEIINGSGNATIKECTGPIQNAEGGVVVSSIMPDLSIEEYLKGIIQMFKLVLIGGEDGKVHVNTLDSYYSQGSRYDISKYIDQSKFEVERGEILSEIAFKFEESDTILAEEFRVRNIHGYGSTEVTLEDENEDVLDGDSLEVELPFEQFVYERLTDAHTDELTSIQTATVADRSLSPVTNKPHLHYISRINVANNPIKFNLWDDLADNNYTPTAIQIDSRVYMPFHHFGVTDPAYSLLFENEYSTYTSNRISDVDSKGIPVKKNNLYSIHYSEYIDAIFELKRRTFKFRAILPIQLLTRLNLNDVLTIEGLDYRINKFETNLLTGVTNLELINGFDTKLGKGVYIPEGITVDVDRKELYFNIPNISGYNVSFTDIGSGTNWITHDITKGDNDNIVELALQSWVAGTDESRNVQVNFTKGSATTSITVSQENYKITL